MSRGDPGCTCRYEGEGEWSTCEACGLKARVAQLEAENAQLRALGEAPPATCKADLHDDLDLPFGFGPGGVP